MNSANIFLKNTKYKNDNEFNSFSEYIRNIKTMILLMNI